MVKRFLALVGIAYVAVAVAGHLAERSGRLVCECADDCWCKRPGLGLFRWAFPYRHSLPEGASPRGAHWVS